MNQAGQRSVTDIRPNPRNKWVCGYAHLGWTCLAGPNEKGVCCQVDAASPTASAPSEQRCRTECAADEASGSPEEPRLPLMPAPCRPRRSAWYWRQTLMLNLAILTGGLLLLCMSLPQREAIFAPGTLSHKHSQLLENQLVSERCSLCHPNSHSNRTSDIIQDDLCLKCHARHLPRAHLRSPHDLPQAELIKLFSKWDPARTGEQELDTTKAFDRAGEQVTASTHCAACHVEHHGPGFDLTAISDASCQACHQRKFASLSLGHPQFESYPYRKLRRLAFDHNSHQQIHFGTKNEDFQCARCHLGSQPSGQLVDVSRGVSFEQACASCHQAPLESATSSGWAVLQLPSIDASDNQTAVAELPDWPSSARFGYEGEITVPMRLLLLADQRMHEALAQLPPSGQLEDIPAEGPLRGQVARSLAQGLRSLIREVAAEGHVAWQRRLSKSATYVLERELSSREKKLIQLLSQGVPPDLFRQMDQQWFGKQAGIAARDANRLHLTSQTVNAKDLRPGGPSDDLLGGSDDDSLGGPGETLLDGSDDALLGGSGDALLGELDDDLLIDSAKDSLLLEMDTGAATDALLLESQEGARQSVDVRELKVSTEANTSVQLRGSVHVAAGGWYLDSQLLALRYMPVGHADPTLAAWAEFVALLDGAQVVQTGESPPELTATLPRPVNSTGEHADLEQQLALGHLTHGAVVPGGCTQCHLLSANGVGPAVTDSWTALKPPAIRQFTKFNHAPHLTLASLTDCSHCHVLQDNRDDRLGKFFQATDHAHGTIAPSSVSRNVQQFLAHEFVDMRLEQCVACHVPGGANDACTQCHNYHVDFPIPP